MATNFHSDLPNDQIHAPKDFSVASDSSVIIKSSTSTLDWEASFYNLSSTVTCGADVAGGLHMRSFHIYYTATSFVEVHIIVTGESGTFTPTPGWTQAPVTIAANASAIIIADEIKAAILLLNSGPFTFVSSVDGTGKVTFSGMSNCKDTVDSDLSFSIANTKTFYGEQLLYADASGDIYWKEADTIPTMPLTDNNNAHFDWTGTFMNKTSAGNNDWHLMEHDRGSYNNHSKNLGTSAPTTLPPTWGLNAGVFYANYAMQLRSWFTMINGTAASGETIHMELHHCTPATGTGLWTLTSVDTVTGSIDNTQVSFFTGGTGVALAIGDILIPAIKINTTTSTNITYRSTLQLEFV